MTEEPLWVNTSCVCSAPSSNRAWRWRTGWSDSVGNGLFNAVMVTQGARRTWEGGGDGNLSHRAVVTLLLYPAVGDLTQSLPGTSSAKKKLFWVYLCFAEGFDPFRIRTISYCRAVLVPFAVLGAMLGEESSITQCVRPGLVWEL